MVRARFFLPAAALVATALQAQDRIAVVAAPMVAGVIRDVGGVPIPDAEVGIVRGERLQQFAITAADGKFLLTGVASGMVPLRIRRLGYAIQLLDVDTRIPSSATLEIVLKSVASELEDVTIAANEQFKLREFYEHKQQRGSFGRFLEQNEIRRMGPTNPSDLFRTVPGVVIASASGGNTVRIRGCQPMVWVDGQRVPGAELDEVVHPSEIAAIEFYPSNAGIPAQYLERSNRLCGSVIVWTRTQ
ncbi:MAG: Plug and carboxypeptidase regulatory-like domain-containing protein [Gemmatimonadota bacterium]|nr:Plug and carboxypeptidase regulatory-like domain-containing protein [Gemmatimonadota bacterium]